MNQRVNPTRLSRGDWAQDTAEPLEGQAIAVPDPEAQKIRQQLLARAEAEHRRMVILWQKLMLGFGIWIFSTATFTVCLFAIWSFHGALFGMGLGFAVLVVLLIIWLDRIWSR